jgi:hypothetical protein
VLVPLTPPDRPARLVAGWPAAAPPEVPAIVAPTPTAGDPTGLVPAWLAASPALTVPPLELPAELRLPPASLGSALERVPPLQAATAQAPSKTPATTMIGRKRGKVTL